MKLKQALFIFFFFPLTVFSQAYQPSRISENLKLDGRMDEASWLQAPVETDLMQEDPSAGATPPERTEVRILYNDEFLSVGIRAFDGEPEKIVRSALDRDLGTAQDDAIFFVVDT